MVWGNSFFYQMDTSLMAHYQTESLGNMFAFAIGVMKPQMKNPKHLNSCLKYFGKDTHAYCLKTMKCD